MTATKFLRPSLRAALGLLLVLGMTAAPAVAQVSPHGEIAIPCEACHSADSWTLRSDATFNHDSTGFSLLGRTYVLTRKEENPSAQANSKHP